MTVPCCRAVAAVLAVLVQASASIDAGRGATLVVVDLTVVTADAGRADASVIVRVWPIFHAGAFVLARKGATGCEPGFAVDSGETLREMALVKKGCL